jgi:transcriptional repressor NrdR
MRCPYCGADDTRVVDSRPMDGGAAIRRRRGCEQCGNRFTTYERAALMVRKRDGSLQPFDSKKIAVGIEKALAGREVDAGVIEAVVAAVEVTAHERGPEVSAEDIGHRVLEELRSTDEVAYLRFASVYKEFEGASDFEREMAALEDG